MTTEKRELGDGMVAGFIDGELDAIRVTLPGTPPTQNERERWHWAERRRNDQEWIRITSMLFQQAVSRAGLTAGEPPFPWQRVDIAFQVRFAHPGRRDVANLIGGVKPLVDALLPVKQCPMGVGIIRDDSYIYLDSVQMYVYRALVRAPETIMVVIRCRHD